ncbi:hypothetical protein [Streptomyces mirabilis]
MNNLQTAFWVAGKSLETMKTGNLHRGEGVPNFADYVMDTWEVSESQAHRLMDAWRIGEALAAMGWTPREAQIRELTDVRNESGDQAAVAVYDTVARSVRRVTAKLLSEVVRELPPLPRQASPADVRKLVQEILTARAAATAASQTPPTGVPAPNGGVPNITSIGKEPTGENSPIGESGSEPSNPKGSGDNGGEIRRLAAALDDLRGVERRLSKPAVKRALAYDAERTEALMKQIDEALNRIGRTIAVRRADA